MRSNSNPSALRPSLPPLVHKGRHGGGPRGTRLSSAMTVSLLRFSFVALFFLSTAPCLAEEPAASPHERSRSHYKAANAAFEAGKKQEARAEYLKALEYERSWDIWCNLGRTEGELGLDADALEHLDICLREYPANGEAKVQEARAKFYDLRAAIRERCGEVGCKNNPEVNSGLGRRIEPVYSARSNEQVSTVEAPAAKPPISTTPPPPVPTPNSSAKWPVVLGLGAAGLVGVGVGIGFWVHSDGLAADARRLRSDLQDENIRCEDPTHEGCATYASKVSDHETARAVAIAGFAAGGALFLTSAVLGLVWPEAPKGSARLRPVGGFGPGGGFVGLSGAF